VWYEVLED